MAPARGRPRARVPSSWGHSCCWRRKIESKASLLSCRHPEGGREACACACLCNDILQSTIKIFCRSQPRFSRLALLSLLPALHPARCHPCAQSRETCKPAKTYTNLALQTFATRKPSGLLSATFGACFGASLLQKGSCFGPCCSTKCPRLRSCSPDPAHTQQENVSSRTAWSSRELCGRAGRTAEMKCK